MCLISASVLAFKPAYAESSEAERDQAEETNLLVNALTARWGPTMIATAAQTAERNIATTEFMINYALDLANNEIPKPRSYAGDPAAPGPALVRDFARNMNSEPFWQCLALETFDYRECMRFSLFSGVELGFRLRVRLPIQQVETAALWQSDYFPRWMFEMMESIKGMEQSWYPVARVFSPLNIYLVSQLTPLQQEIHESISGTEEAELEGLDDVPGKYPSKQALKEHSQRSRLAAATYTRAPRLEYRVHPTLFLILYVINLYILEYYLPAVAEILKKITGLDKRMPILASEAPPFIYFSRNPFLQIILGIMDVDFLLKYAVAFLGYPGLCVGSGDLTSALAVNPLYPPLIGGAMSSLGTILSNYGLADIRDICIKNWGRVIPMDTHPLQIDHTNISGINTLKGIRLGRQLQKLIGSDSSGGGGGGGDSDSSLSDNTSDYIDQTAGENEGSVVSESNTFSNSSSGSDGSSGGSSSSSDPEQQEESDSDIYWGFYEFVIGDDAMQWTYGDGLEKDRCFEAGEMFTPLGDGSDGGKIKDGGYRSVTHWKSLTSGCIMVWPPSGTVDSITGLGSGSTDFSASYDTTMAAYDLWKLLDETIE